MDIDQSGHTVGEFIYDSLLAKPDQKIKGKLVRTIERKYYRQELSLILKKQQEFNKKLQDKELYTRCLEELYPKNELHRRCVSVRDFAYLFIDDIIFYQRPLKSKKSLIDDCPYEKYHYLDNGKDVFRPIKCVSKSHPLYQEFRLWQFVDSLRIFERTKLIDGRLHSDVDVTAQFLKDNDDYAALFDFLNDRSSVNQDVLLTKYFNIKKPRQKDAVIPYRWNYVEEKEYPCNETRSAMLAGFKKAGIPQDVLTTEITDALWHILYSISDKQELGKALDRFAEKNRLDKSFVDVFSKIKPYDSSYGAYSAKAISKLLPLMRRGKYWNLDAIDTGTRRRIDKIINGEFDESISNRVWEKSALLKTETDYQGLPLWLACYVVYNRHSETGEIVKWNTPNDIDVYLNSFKQHSLRNPIVEQVVLETLRTVRDIWKKTGSIDEIHVELGREMKNPADKRARMSQQNIANENTNLRIKSLLTEFANPQFNIENVRPYSPTQQDILRIYEDYALSSLKADDQDYEFIHKMSMTAQPSHSDVVRYKLWLEQKYISPYTGQVIPLTKLFTSAYEIEHIIPQSRYFDDSFTNKVICESEINKLKDKQLGYEFIKNHAGQKVQISQTGQFVEVFSIPAFEEFVKQHYSGPKLKKLLMDDIPDQFIERQMNDSRYISKLIKGLLSNIVREKTESGDYEPEAISKNLIPSNGQITDRLKKDWGVNDVWNSIILPRFIRMNEITGTAGFTAINQEGHVIPAMPLELQKGFNKKRIDHRHHAMDAIVIACTTRDHINLLNNEAALSKNQSNRYALSRKLRRYESVQIEKHGEKKTIEVAREFLLPWPAFATNTRSALDNIVVSFKQNLRVINKATNRYLHFNEIGVKVNDKQTIGNNMAVRKPLHKDTVFGMVNLKLKKQVSLNEAIKASSMIVDPVIKERVLNMKDAGFDTKRIKNELEKDGSISGKIEVYYFTNETNDRYYATRKPIDSSFDEKTILGSVTDTGAQKILLAHLSRCNNDPEIAFSPDGIEQMNRDIRQLNDGHDHKPIFKVRKYEKADKFAVGQTGNKRSKYVEAAKGTNLFFAIYRTETIDKETGRTVFGRAFETVPLNVVIERLKQHLAPVPEQNENGDRLLFWLSPNDLVYVPTPDEIESGHVSEPVDKSRIYKMVSCTGVECHFVPFNVAMPIVNKIEFSPMNKVGRALTGEMIKDSCMTVAIDRLGNLSYKE